jgi:hypothetical protein
LGGGTAFFVNQTTEIIQQLIVVSTLLLGFSFSIVVQFATNTSLSPLFQFARRVFFWALLMFIASTASLLLMLIRIDSYLAVQAVADPGGDPVPTYAFRWFNLLFTTTMLTLGGGLVLWISGLCMLATKDGKRFTAAICIASLIILVILAYALLMPDV